MRLSRNYKLEELFALASGTLNRVVKFKERHMIAITDEEIERYSKLLEDIMTTYKEIVSLEERIEDRVSQVELREQTERLELLMSRLWNSLQAKIIQHSDLTLQAIGDLLGITRERVRQVELAAYKKLKHPKVGRKFKSMAEEFDIIPEMSKDYGHKLYSQH